MDIGDIEWVRTETNIKDFFTKQTTNKVLKNILLTGFLKQTISQWIVRDKKLIQEKQTNKMSQDSTGSTN